MSIYQHVLICSFKGRLIYFWMAYGTQDNEHLPLTPETCHYVTLHGKGELRLQLGLRSLISWP